MNKELKPCPFCGSDAYLYRCDVEIAKPYTVLCENCEIVTKNYASEAEAIKAWNRRAERTVKPKKGAYDLIRCDCGMPVSSNYDYYPKCKAKLEWSDDE